MNEASIPVFPRGVRLRHDRARDQWVVLAPERAFIPDEVAVAILRLIDGKATIADIVTDLAQRYAAPREEIAIDVMSMIASLAEKGVLRI